MSNREIQRKIDQAEFHLEKLRGPESQLAVESHFAAFIAAVRSAVMYVHEWQIANGRASTKNDWTIINRWEKSLPAADHDGWRAVVDLRNADIHTKPVVPAETWQGGYFGGWFGGYMGGYFGARPAQTVEHPNTGNRTKVVELAACALRVVKRLMNEYEVL